MFLGLNKKITRPANFSLNGFLDGQYVTFYSRSSNMILQFDMKSEKIRILEKFSDNDIYDVFNYDSENYWLIPGDDKKPMIKWSVNNHKEKVVNTLKGFYSKRISFQHSAVACGYLWLLPGLADTALKLDLHTQKMKEALEFMPGYRCPDPSIEQWKYQCIENTEDFVWAFDGSDGQMTKVDLKRADTVRKPITCDMKETTKREYAELINDVRKGRFGNVTLTNKREIGKKLFYKVKRC